MANSYKQEGKSTKKHQRPAQTQARQPGRQTKMRPEPVTIVPALQGSGRLSGRVALVTGGDTPLGRAGELWECATCFLFLASLDSQYMTGQILHPNGGEIVNR